MNNLIHYYGEWGKLPIPSNCEVLYIKWDGGLDYNKLSAIIFRTDSKPTLSELIQYVVNQQKEQPIGVSYNYKHF